MAVTKYEICMTQSTYELLVRVAITQMVLYEICTDISLKNQETYLQADVQVTFELYGHFRC